MRLVDNDRWAGEFPLEQQRALSLLHRGRWPTPSSPGWPISPSGSRPDWTWPASSSRGAPSSRPRPAARAGPTRATSAPSPSAWPPRASQADAVAVAHEAALAALMARHLDRRHATRTAREYAVVVDRERARFAAWYELFPRSARGDGQHATFKDAERELGADRRHGFRRRLPAAHPSHRPRLPQGAQQRADAAPGDPGQPVGHRRRRGRPHRRASAARNPGGLRPLRRARGGALGLEVALDFAIQCSPDHPYVREHPEWFFHRPDGTIKYAENPPKKYQDVYPLNFYGADPGPLWEEMRRVVEFWMAHGVRTFRVDNPHTKPVRLLGVADRRASRRARPDVIFLAEAFTRPKMMKVLAKAGFTQSYTYFTWRNEKRGAHRVSRGDHPAPGGRLLPRPPVAEHAGHPARDPADGRAARLQDAAGAGGHALVALRDLQRLRAGRERARARGLRGVPRLREVRDQGARLGRPRQPRGLRHHRQPHPPRAPRPASLPQPALLRRPTTRTSSGTAR